MNFGFVLLFYVPKCTYMHYIKKKRASKGRVIWKEQKRKELLQWAWGQRELDGAKKKGDPVKGKGQMQRDMGLSLWES